MGPVNRQNLERVKLFSLEEYVKKIKLESNILEHVQDTSEQFDKYMELLLSYPDYVVSTFLVESFRNEFESSNLMENHIIHPLDIRVVLRSKVRAGVVAGHNRIFAVLAGTGY